LHNHQHCWKFYSFHNIKQSTALKYISSEHIKIGVSPVWVMTDVTPDAGMVMDAAATVVAAVEAAGAVSGPGAV
jgi:hypothetical protein